jgi:uncharacterized protein (DUF362 family)
VALSRAASYDETLIRNRVQAMLDAVGGLGDVIRPGDRVAIKINLTGGVAWEGVLTTLPGEESWVTHPMVVRALAEAVRDAGAGELLIVEGVYEAASFTRWGYESIAADLGATLINLNSPQPYSQFELRDVGENHLIYDQFMLNPITLEVDAFLSVTKLKCHACAGVTLSMKNLVGLVPANYYRLSTQHNHRSTLHGPGQAFRHRLPRVIMDLNMLRPIHFALIDGVMTSEGGEGPWNQGWHPVRPGILVAGKNPTATDAVAAAAMGFDPQARSLAEDPFRLCENHLAWANRLGMGPIDLSEIDIVGEALDDVRYPFRPFSGTAEDAATSFLSHPQPGGLV